MAKPYGTYEEQNNTSSHNPRQQGVFGLHPLATPKYAKNVGLRDAEYKESLARIYVSLADASDAVRQQYLASLPSDAATQALAKVLLGSNAKSGAGFVDFFLTQVGESFQEISQVDKVMADDYVAFFYGQSPPTFQYSGVLLNSMQDDQRSGFARAYQLMLRGTQLARRGALVRLRYDSVIVSGTMVASSQSMNAENEMAVPFSFSILVKEYVLLNNPKFARTSEAQYVRLAADAAVRALTPVGAASDTRVRTVVVSPAEAAATTATGPLAFLKSARDAVLRANATTSNIRGTITPTAPTPPAVR